MQINTDVYLQSQGNFRLQRRELLQQIHTKSLRIAEQRKGP